MMDLQLYLLIELNLGEDDEKKKMMQRFRELKLRMRKKTAAALRCAVFELDPGACGD